MVTMPRIHSFQPIADSHARVLILGTVPSVLSLDKQQYYGNPRNQFWPIIYDLFNRQPDDDYASRTAFLLEKRIAIWDVLESCRRTGSSDAKITDPVPNDFETFFARHPNITTVFFNGSKAEELFHRLVAGKMQRRDGIAYDRLPSTSPAHAVPFEKKLQAWKIILKSVNHS